MPSQDNPNHTFPPLPAEALPQMKLRRELVLRHTPFKSVNRQKKGGGDGDGGGAGGQPEKEDKADVDFEAGNITPRAHQLVPF